MYGRFKMNQPIQQQYVDPYRPLQPNISYSLQQGRHIPPNVPLELTGLDPGELAFQQELQRLHGTNATHQSPYPALYNGQQPRRSFQQQNNASPHTPLRGQQRASNENSPYNMSAMSAQHSSIARIQQEEPPFELSDDKDQQSIGHAATRIEVNPPNLEEWRERLFAVDEMITLGEEDFQIYFPHVDNVYSHRSTQKYKKKPFVSHYWDCRLKGRPPGTPKSEDPNKKKRKRTARERDLCDVKIKITEYFPGAMLQPGFIPDGPQGEDNAESSFIGQTDHANNVDQHGQFAGAINRHSLPIDHPGATGKRYYTIQRVNGNGGNGKGDGVAGPHKHTLEDSDKIKKNSIQRHIMKREKEDKKTQKTYHKKATGAALATVKRHSKDHELKLFGSCFCPFVQRVWISLEAKGMQYQYIEVDPYKKPKELLDVNPRGLVPGIKHGDWGCGESTVLMEYLEDLEFGSPLLPAGNPKLKATCRLWSDHINRKIIPAFYQLLQAQDQPKQLEAAKSLQSKVDELIQACPDRNGPYFLGSQLSFVDIQFAPWILRFKRVLKPYRAWPDPEQGSRWQRWCDAIEDNEFVQHTTSTDELYIESYERYAENRPGTSELANAINEGGGLP